MGIRLQQHRLVLSHGYAPIEQYREGGVKEFSPQTDLYSLAATLYYILSGTVPPQATTLVEDDLIFPTSFPSYLEWYLLGKQCLPPEKEGRII